MIENKKKPVATEVVAKIQVQEVKEELKPQAVQDKIIPTLKQRIDGVVDEYYQDKDELKKQVFKLVQHVQHPEQFCPNCDERMFFDADTVTYNCPNCEYRTSVTVPNSTANIKIPVRASGAVPPQVEKAIAAANEAMKETPIPSRPTALGDKIRKLVADRDSGGASAPTKEDEARIKGFDKNVANKINFV